MRILVAGPRTDTNAPRCTRVLSLVHQLWGIGLLIHGACHLGGPDKPGEGGTDWLADAWAVERGIEMLRCPVDHALDGSWPAAGPRRNRRMIATCEPDGFVGFQDEKGAWTAGTGGCRALAIAAGLRVWES